MLWSLRNDVDLQAALLNYHRDKKEYSFGTTDAQQTGNITMSKAKQMLSKREGQQMSHYIIYR